MSAAGPPQQPTGGGSGDDPFSWLYRRGETAPTEDEPPVVPATIEPPPPVRPQQAPIPPPVAAPRPLPPPPDPYPQPFAQPVVQPAPLYDKRPPTSPPATPPPRNGPRPGVVIGVIVGLLVLAVIAAYVVVAFVLRPADRSVLDPPRVASSTSAPRVVKPVVSGVRADCTAPPATDDAGARVSYGAANVLDGKSSTAWRCNGTGVGHSLTFTFPAGSTIGSVGVINGYAKTDPKSGAKRYSEYRRITRVTWTFDDGTTMTQPLADDDQKLQTMAVPPHRTQTLKLTVEASTEPGSNSSTRDAVLISSVVFS